MTPAIVSSTFAVALICALAMGLAIQRGATCTVAAVAEVVEDRTAKRLLALAEASLWVAGGLLIARALGVLPALPKGFAFGWWTIAGGALLGGGAYINSACVFGSIARLGSGQVAYALTPLGYYIGAASAPGVFSHMMPNRPLMLQGNGSMSYWLALPIAAVALWRIFGAAKQLRGGSRNWQRVWAPHEATILIGITFVILLVAVGNWGYTQTLTELAHGMTSNLAWQLLLFVALLAGASLGGMLSGRFQVKHVEFSVLFRCLLGGIFMGWGSLLIPGSNDGLILVGLPLLQPYAWVAVLTMCLVIWCGLTLERYARQP